LCSTGC